MYDRLEGNRVKIFEGGRDREGIEPVEYCDKRFFEACDIGRPNMLLRAGGEVMSGGRGGWLGLAVGEPTAGGEETGLDPGDMTAVIFWF